MAHRIQKRVFNREMKENYKFEDISGMSGSQDYFEKMYIHDIMICFFSVCTH